MDPQLTDTEVRVLGCLIEKAITTPDHYPLTLNALTAACNQRSNRDPVVRYDERTVVRGLDGLRDKKLAWMLSGASRVPKYEHSLTNVLDLDPAQVASLCVLMLRGPQTVGEIRTRTGRLHAFEDLDQVEAVLEQLVDRETGPALVTKLPRQSGRKEPRYAHLLAGEPEIEEDPIDPAPELARLAVQEENERLEQLCQAVEDLRGELATLRDEFAEFRRQFE